MRPDLLPASVVEGNVEWIVSRAWPESDGRLAVEVFSHAIRGVRAGHWHHGTGFQLLPAGTDPRLPALDRLAAEGEVISHRVNRRAVVRLRTSGHFVKVVKPRKAPAVIEAADRGAPFARGFRFAHALRDPEREQSGAVTLEALAGRTLHSIGQDSSVSAAEWDEIWAAWARAWVAVAASPTPEGVAHHTAENEAEVLRIWGQRIAQIEPDLTAVADLTATIAHRIAAHPADPVLAHRDLHDKQLLWDGSGRMGILDVDTIALAEPALDLANLRAHVRFRVRQELWSPDAADIAVSHIDAVAERLRVEPERMALAEAATWLRVGGLYLFRPRWRDLARDLLRSTLAEVQV